MSVADAPRVSNGHWTLVLARNRSFRRDLNAEPVRSGVGCVTGMTECAP